MKASHKIAIIGGGISGMGTAWYLDKTQSQIKLFEANPSLGGHARTVQAGSPPVDVDTGFIVFNYRNYPLLTELFAALDVPVKKSRMSFSFSSPEFQYSFKSLSGALSGNWHRPKFYQMLADLIRFNKEVLNYANKSGITVADLIKQMRLRKTFVESYLLPMSGAIWSSSARSMMDFPAKMLADFFENHGLLTLFGHPQWWTVEGGSQTYVAKMETALKAKGVEIALGNPVRQIRRTPDGIQINTDNGEPETFSHVVFACHTDAALQMLTDADHEERSLLQALRYHANKAYLHSDASLMPDRQSCWSAWNYISTPSHKNEGASVTYWMNELQSIKSPLLLLSLNPPRLPDPVKIYDEHIFRHPVYSLEMLNTRKKISRIQGQGGCWYANANLGSGFHEDGLKAAQFVSESINIQLK